MDEVLLAVDPHKASRTVDAHISPGRQTVDARTYPAIALAARSAPATLASTLSAVEAPAGAGLLGRADIRVPSADRGLPCWGMTAV